MGSLGENTLFLGTHIQTPRVPQRSKKPDESWLNLTLLEVGVWEKIFSLFYNLNCVDILEDEIRLNSFKTNFLIYTIKFTDANFIKLRFFGIYSPHGQGESSGSTLLLGAISTNIAYLYLVNTWSSSYRT